MADPERGSRSKPSDKEIKRQGPMTACLAGINKQLALLEIPTADIQNVSIPQVVLADDPLTTRTFQVLEVEDIPIVVLSDPQERVANGPITVSVKDDVDIAYITSTNFDLSEHLPLVENPVSLATPPKDWRHDMNPGMYKDERYFSFHAIPGRGNPFIRHIHSGNYVFFQDRRDDKNMYIIVADARFPAPDSQRDVTFFSASVPRQAMEQIKPARDVTR